MKYNSKTVTIDGIKFDSKAEANHYCELKLLERGHIISGLRVHPKYVLQESFTYRGERERAIVYEADFEFEENGETVVEDVKGYKTKDYNIKKKLFEYKYPQYVFREVNV